MKQRISDKAPEAPAKAECDSVWRPQQTIARTSGPIQWMHEMAGNRAVGRALQAKWREGSAARAPTAASAVSRPRSSGAELGGGGSLLQRKCAACDLAGQESLQAKLGITEPGDVHEQEADRVAAQVVQAPGTPVTVSPIGPMMQRECAGCEEEEPLQPKRSDPASGAGGAAIAPPIVGEVLRAPGQPLDAATRTAMQTSFGRDLGGIRLHTGSQAAASADAVGARAYTVGRDIVFAAGQYAPHTASGQQLLAHEITHTFQQGAATDILQRSCIQSPCPPVPVSVSALFPRYEAAEKCIQSLYERTHPASRRNVSLSFNLDWLHMTGATTPQRLALGCLRGEETPGAGPNFTARGGMRGGEPDIWDFNNRSMYEITTRSGYGYRVGKLGWEIDLANRLCSPSACGGLTFDRGTWSPPTGCVSLGGDLYFTAANTNGVIVYEIVKDATKELALATVLALMAAAMKSQGPKMAAALVGRAAGAKVLGRAVPAYAVASLAAMAVLLASGRAEAKVGPGEDEPLLQLFEAMAQKGTPVPKEIQDMIEANPDLKAKINAAMKQGGDSSALQEELNKQILDIIAANKDQFTPEELEILLASTHVAGKALPKGDMTVDRLKELAAAAKEGRTGEGEGTGGGRAPKDAPKPDTPKPDTSKPEVKQTSPDAAKAQESKKTAGISKETMQKLDASPQPVRELFNSLLGSGADAQKVADADLQRFLSIVPPDLTSEQAKLVRERLKPASGKTIDEILDSLEAAVDQLGLHGGASARKPDDKPHEPKSAASTEAAPPPDAATMTTDLTAGAPTTDPAKLVQELATKAKTSTFKDLKPGTYRVTWMPHEKGKPGVGTRISGSLRGKLPNGTGYVGRVVAEVIAARGDKLSILFVTSTPFVSADGKVVVHASDVVGREQAVVLDPPAKRKK